MLYNGGVEKCAVAPLPSVLFLHKSEIASPRYEYGNLVEQPCSLSSLCTQMEIRRISERTAVIEIDKLTVGAQKLFVLV